MNSLALPPHLQFRVDDPNHSQSSEVSSDSESEQSLPVELNDLMDFARRRVNLLKKHGHNAYKRYQKIKRHLQTIKDDGETHLYNWNTLSEASIGFNLTGAIGSDFQDFVETPPAERRQFSKKAKAWQKRKSKGRRVAKSRANSVQSSSSNNSSRNRGANRADEPAPKRRRLNQQQQAQLQPAPPPPKPTKPERRLAAFTDKQLTVQSLVDGPKTDAKLAVVAVVHCHPSGSDLKLIGRRGVAILKSGLGIDMVATSFSFPRHHFGDLIVNHTLLGFRFCRMEDAQLVFNGLSAETVTAIVGALDAELPAVIKKKKKKAVRQLVRVESSDGDDFLDSDASDGTDNECGLLAQKISAMTTEQRACLRQLLDL